MALIDWISSNRKAKPERKPGDQPSPVARVSWVTQQPIPSVSYQDAISAEKAIIHPVLFRVLHKIANAVSSVQWYIDYDPAAKNTEKPKKATMKALEDLLHSPNDILAEDQLRYWMALSFATYGRTPLKIGVGTAGLPNGIYPLAATMVKANLDNRGIVKTYTYGSNDNKETLPTRRSVDKMAVKTAYAYEIAIPNLQGNVEAGKSTTPLQACGLPADVITLLLQRAADTAAGHPNSKYIVTAEKTLTVKQKAALKDQILDTEVNQEESGHILFLYNTKVDVHKLDNDLSNIHSKVPLDDMSRMIAGLFGVPVALMGFGASDAAKFASNYGESRESFWADTIIPMYLNPIATGLTAAICPYGARVRFDLDSIESLQASRMARAKDLKDVTFLTDDEKRELCGYGPLKDTKPADPDPADTTGQQTDD